MRSLISALFSALCLTHVSARPDTPPIKCPPRAVSYSWTLEIPWDHVVDITSMAGENWDTKFETAQASLGPGGGVVYFPEGDYLFAETLRLRDGIVLRGAPLRGIKDAKHPEYRPPSRIRFPKFNPKLKGEGTLISSAFKGIHLIDPGAARNVGVVDLDIDHGHIYFGQGEAYAAGANRLIIGCRLTNAAVADPNVPDTSIGQHPWQRFTNGARGAIRVYTGENALIANNRLPESDSSFDQPGYVVLGRGDTHKQPVTLDGGVRFDYDNRSGIKVNPYVLGGGGGVDPKYTPEERPWGFRKGIVIRDNFVYATGRTSIQFSGDGTVCSFNEISFPKDIRRYTHTGRHLAGGPSTNGNRAILMSGWRYTVEGNIYEVYSNWAADSGYRINDGEGLMHEGHANSTVKQSQVLRNSGNAYLSVYKTAGIDGLLVEGNTFRVPKGAAIYVVADRNWDRNPCRDVIIRDNSTEGGGILIAGEPADGNLITGNRHEGQTPGLIQNVANAEVLDNTGYETVDMVRGKKGRYRPVREAESP